MNLIKQNKPAERPSNPSASNLNVSTYVKKEEKVYVRRYAMSESRRRRWLENFKKDQADNIMSEMDYLKPMADQKTHILSKEGNHYSATVAI